MQYFASANFFEVALKNWTAIYHVKIVSVILARNNLLDQEKFLISEFQW